MFFDDLVANQKQGVIAGIPSICSAHPWVLRAALRGEGPVLIESTCNQVNQYGGYTGQTPMEFIAYVNRIAAENGFPAEKILLGGDHLGPSVWATENTNSAMTKAEELVREYVAAGYQKIHLDTSMHLGDDNPSQPLEAEIVAHRTARLARAAELEYKASRFPALHYVIGTEVPPPGGARQYEDKVQVTKVSNARQTIEATRLAFIQAGLEAAWERVMAIVVQPGVEFGDEFVLEYHPQEARSLVQFIEDQPMLVFEAHSTDYQSRASLRNLVRDHFAILKVGPRLTYAFRQAMFALAMLEEEIFPADMRSNLLGVIDGVMLRQPQDWQKYYSGSPAEQAYKRKYSLSDRIRYYWPHPEVQAALQRLLHNLSENPVPPTLVSQLIPELMLRKQDLLTPQAFILASITAVLQDYKAACGNSLAGAEG
jgi:D-tagatose-1,6-bisphosphate aldolase subunit GatZ/KbaZ